MAERNDLLGGLGFYVVLPIVLSLPFGVTRAGAAASLPELSAIGFWALGFVAAWAMHDLCTRACAAVLRPLSSPLFLVLALGVVFSTPLQDPWTLWRFELFFPHGSGPLVHLLAGANLPSYLSTFVKMMAPAMLYWCGANFVMFYGLKRDRYGYEAPSRRLPLTVDVASELTDPGSAFARFSQAFPDLAPADVLAAHAQEHYVSLRTRKGSKILKSSFRNAINSLASVEGCQVHRSYWVAKAGIDRVRMENKQQFLVLSDGFEIPVGRSYSLNLKALGFV